MGGASRNLIVVGQGAAGLAAALAAAEAARAHGRPINVTLVDKAPEDEAGGNTRWSPSNMRMASPDRVEPSFVHDMLAATNFQGDESYFARLAKEAPATVKWLASHGIEFIQPTYYLAKGPPRIQPVGGGPVLIKELTRAARQAGVVFLYGCVAREIANENGRITGLVVEQNGTRQTLAADAIVLACGGFQGNADMMRAHFGEGAATMRLISPGTRFNTGDGIRMAQRLGADRSGDWNGMHAEPVDARAKNSAPVVLVYPYGIVVDKNGRRFFDEGAGLVHETWEWFARAIHFKAPGSMAYAILDSRLFEIADYQRAIRSELPPVRADTLAELAKLIGVDADNLVATVAAYNAACVGDPRSFRRDPLRRACGRANAAAAEVELGARRQCAAIPRLSAGRRRGVHIRWAGNGRPCPRAARRRANPRPVRCRRDYRAFLCDCAECRIGAARVCIRQDCRARSG